MSLIFSKSIFKILGNPKRNHNHFQNCRSLAIFRKQNNVKEVTSYIIVRANKKDHAEILKCMHDSYYGEEPTVSALNITPNTVMDEKAVKAMTEGYTLVAKCKYNGCIVGACINGSTSPWDADLDEKLACSIKSDNIKKLLLFHAYVMKAPDLWRCLGVQKVFEMAYLFVRRPHRKKGLAYRLLQESKALGADAGFPVLRCDATNTHTAKICERLGMQKVAEIPYCTYLDQNLEPIFKPPWPHEGVKIYCDCAPQFNELNRKIQDKSKKFSLFSAQKHKSKEHHV